MLPFIGCFWLSFLLCYCVWRKRKVKERGKDEQTAWLRKLKLKDDHYAEKIRQLEGDIEMAKGAKEDSQEEREAAFDEKRQDLLGQVTLLQTKITGAEAAHRKAIERMEEDCREKVQSLEMMTETLQAEVGELNAELETLMEGAASVDKSATRTAPLI
ncbi:unnamed protein product [Amoebophrya sp. A25]|nr:unnamed protein product [Amoebophrya sp. A25]|eukprot:GSA25T00026342001.1